MRGRGRILCHGFPGGITLHPHRPTYTPSAADLASVYPVPVAYPRSKPPVSGHLSILVHPLPPNLTCRPTQPYPIETLNPFGSSSLNNNNNHNNHQHHHKKTQPPQQQPPPPPQKTTTTMITTTTKKQPQPQPPQKTTSTTESNWQC